MYFFMKALNFLMLISREATYCSMYENKHEISRITIICVCFRVCANSVVGLLSNTELENRALCKVLILQVPRGEGGVGGSREGVRGEGSFHCIRCFQTVWGVFLLEHKKRKGEEGGGGGGGAGI